MSQGGWEECEWVDGIRLVDAHDGECWSKGKYRSNRMCDGSVGGKVVGGGGWEGRWGGREGRGSEGGGGGGAGWG